MTTPTPPNVLIVWRDRQEPLPIAGVFAFGPNARTLATRLLARPDDALAKLRGVAKGDVIVVLGDGAELPWLDGVVYLGRDPRAPSLLVPTYLEPSLPSHTRDTSAQASVIELVERALVRRVGVAPIAVLPDPMLLVPCAGALSLARRPLDAFARHAA